MSRRRRLCFAASSFALVTVAAGSAQEGSDPSKEVLQRHSTETSRLILVVGDVLGPMPAVAATPFFGLAVLTGAALASDIDLVRSSSHPYLRRFREHALISEARKYASPSFLLLVVLLTVLSYLANSGKIRGIVGKLIRAAEDSSVAVCYFLLAFTTAAHATPPSGASPVSLAGPLPLAVASPGAVDVAVGLLVGLGVGTALAVMMVVRFAFDVLIWLSPFPLVDFAFETAKKAFSAAFLFLCVTYPAAATVLSLLMLSAAVLLLPWAVRLLGFAYRILLNPILGRLLPGLRPRLVDPSFAAQGRVALAAPAQVLNARGLRKRQAGILFRENDQLFFRFRSRPFAGEEERRPLLGHGEWILVGRALGWIELRVVGSDGTVRDRWALSRLLLEEYEELIRLLGAEDAGTFGAARLFASAPARTPAVC